MRVSFVIPAHNEELNLPATLRAIAEAVAALHLDAEIIVADDASTDRTAAIAREHGATVVAHERRQISATRNLGARASRGEVLIFVDADTLVNADAVRDSLDAIARGSVGGGALVTFDGWIPFYAKVLLAVLTRLFRWTKQCGGAYFFARRDTLEQAGWWDETVFAAEEIFLAKRLKLLGRFEIITPLVVTSGRKLRTYSFAEVFKFFLWAPILGKKLYTTKKHLGLWYDPRREDPYTSTGVEATPPQPPPATRGAS